MMNDLYDEENKMIQTIIDKDNNVYWSTRKFVYAKINGNIVKQSRSNVEDAIFIKGVPDGKCIIYFYNKTIWKINNVVEGRVFDFIQELSPIRINEAGYDNTIRGEFPQLLDIDHAVEIDKLRKYMQDGMISHYEYDDCNPVYPKAGK